MSRFECLLLASLSVGPIKIIKIFSSGTEKLEDVANLRSNISEIISGPQVKNQTDSFVKEKLCCRRAAVVVKSQADSD